MERQYRDEEHLNINMATCKLFRILQTTNSFFVPAAEKLNTFKTVCSFYQHQHADD
jgi:hypothetical protein